jgi:3-oxoacyl-[acyl-carrier-protein] synthase II
MARRRVYVRGVGARSPLGESWATTCAALADGASAIRPITRFDATGFPSTVAAAIELADDGSDEAAREDRRRPLALAAAREAWRDAALSVAPERLGIFVGAESGRGTFATVLGLARAAGGPPFDAERFAREARSFADRIDAAVISPAAVAAALAAEWRAAGPVETLSLACASGAAAIVEAVRAIRLGHCDVAIAGGVGVDVDPMMIAGFGLLGILSARGVSCPFDAHRDGFVVGEGAGILVIESRAHALGRGAPILAEIVGYGMSADAHHPSAPPDDGDGVARVMAAALEDAALAPDTIDYLNAHATSTPLGDRAEAIAIERVFGDHAPKLAVSSTKSMTGHLLGGAGALEAGLSVLAIRDQVAPPTINLERRDEGIALNLVPNASARVKIDYAMTNSFGFGGTNACLILRRP